MDFNGSFSYGALVNNDGVAPATPPITLEEPQVRSRSTDSSAGTNDLKRDWSSIFEVCLERPLGFLCQFCWPRPCPAAPGVQWLMGVQDVISLCLTPLLPELSKPKCNLRDIFLLETMLAVFWRDRTSQRADVTWVTLQQSRCCALRFPAVKSSQIIRYPFFRWDAPQNHLVNNDVTECGSMQDWKNCQWKCLHRLPSWFFYFHHLIVLTKWAKGAICPNYCNVFIKFQLWL